MLSTMSHAIPASFPSSPGPPPNMATSLPIIPRGPAAGQRPKLSITTVNTTRSFGKGASLRLDTLSAVSPTRLNTFSNAYPALDRRLANATSAATTPSPASTLSSAPTSASQDSATLCVPYKQPHNLVSVLANSPARALVPRKMATARPMFPAAKHVSFRTPLEEEITTTKYTLAHSDLDASSACPRAATQHALASNSSAQPSASLAAKTAPSFALRETSPPPQQPRTGDKRDSSSSEDDSDSCPETPIAGRRKRTRDWRWTLGPISASDKSTASHVTITEHSY